MSQYGTTRDMGRQPEDFEPPPGTGTAPVEDEYEGPTGSSEAEGTEFERGTPRARAVPDLTEPNRPAAGVKGAAASGTAMGSQLLRDPDAFRRRWESVQVGFVDDPRTAVDEAEALVSSIIDELVGGFRDQRQQLEEGWRDGGDASTDQLRLAFQRYREFFDRLLLV